MEYIDFQDIFVLLDHFGGIMNQNSWPDTGSKKMLFHVTNTKYHDFFKDLNTIENCFTALCNNSYPACRALELYQKIKSIKQDDYYPIEQYKSDIITTVQKLAVAKK